jgi:hypothetical protein
MTPTTQLRDAFVHPSAQRKLAMELHAKATADLRRLVHKADAAGIPRSEIALWSRMTRQAIYDILRTPMPAGDVLVQGCERNQQAPARGLGRELDPPTEGNARYGRLIAEQ